MIRFACPHCEKKYEVEDQFGGRAAKCPECGKAFSIPTLETYLSFNSHSNTTGEISSGTPSRACPSCNAALQTDAVLCIQCGFDLRTGQKLKTKIDYHVPTCVEDISEVRRFKVKSTITAASLSYHGSRAFVCSEAGLTRLWDVETGQVMLCYRSGRHAVNCNAISPDGRFGLVGGRVPGVLRDKSGLVIALDLQTGRELFRMTEHSRSVTFVGFVYQGEFFVTSSVKEGKAIVWETHSGRQVRTIEFKRPFGFAGIGLVREASSADGTRMAVLNGNFLSVLDIEKGTVAGHHMQFPNDITHVAYVSDSDMLVFGGAIRYAKVAYQHRGVLYGCRHDMQGDSLMCKTGEFVTALAVGRSAFFVSGHCGFKPTFGEEGSLCLWSCKSRLRPIQTFDDDGIAITALSVSGDGRRVISGDTWGGVKVWGILG